MTIFSFWLLSTLELNPEHQSAHNWELKRGIESLHWRSYFENTEQKWVKKWRWTESKETAQFKEI